MHINDDVLLHWIAQRKMRESLRRYTPAANQELERYLEQLAALLEQRTPGNFLRLRSPRSRDFAEVPRAGRARIEQIYSRLVDASGAGKHATEEMLLQILGRSAHEQSIPFFRGLVNLSRPRDTFGLRRRELALAGLAYIALHRQSAEAVAALCDFTRHEKPEVRAAAIHAFGQILIEGGLGLAEGTAELQRAASSDPDFQARYLARRLCVRLELRWEAGPQAEALAFEVKHRSSGAARTLEMAGHHTLGDLSYAILAAFHFDTDHLFEFYLNSERGDARFTVPNEEDADAIVTHLAALGFRVGQRFLYLYDFGDTQWFAIKVVGVQEHLVRGAKYPRVTSKKGKAPKQYSL